MTSSDQHISSGTGLGPGHPASGGTGPSGFADWQTLQHEAQGHLQALLRCDTTNLPGNEITAARYLHDRLEEEGIDSEIIEPAPGRASIWARVAGTGAKRPLMLLSHTDVVPVERERWSVDPFGGVEHDGFIYGRGAIDMKQMTAIQLTIMRQIARHIRAGGALPQRDLIFLAVADEERSGLLGMQWLVRHRPELLDVEYALNEGGGSSVMIGDREVFVLEAAQKGSAHITLRAEGAPGHASVPHDDNAILRLARALDHLGAGPLPLHVIPTTQRFFDVLAEVAPTPVANIFRLALQSERSEWALRQLPDEGIANSLRAMLHNTATPTMLAAGVALNVIPSTASAEIDLRLIPGQTPEMIVEEIATRIDDPRVAVEIDFHSPGYALPYATDLAEAISVAVSRHAPGSVVAPYLFPAVSDSRFLAPRGVIPYGFIPHRYEPGQPMAQAMAHGHDERISLANLAFGLRVLHDTIEAICFG